MLDACSSATSTTSASNPACSALRAAARAADGARVRSRTPRPWASTRWSMPRIHTGRSQSSRARSPATSTTAHPPSASAAKSVARSGSATTAPANTSSIVTSAEALRAFGLPTALRWLRTAIPANSSTVTPPDSSSRRACRAATEWASGHRGVMV